MHSDSRAPTDAGADGDLVDAGPLDDGDMDIGDADASRTCGNGRLDPGELCDDGSNNSDTQADACRNDCLPARCGDGVLDSGETCDGSALGNHTCQDQGFYSGTLRCTASCMAFDVTGCSNCGDGVCAEEDGERQETCRQDCGWVTAAIGTTHACGILGDGSLWCWGNNATGQLGLGTWHTPTGPPAPPRVVAWFQDLGLRVDKVAAGDYHTCAIAHDGQVYCWGANASGQVGDGVGTDSHALPVRVAGLPDGSATDIACGGRFSCAILEGAVWCWGSNEWSSLGILPGDTLPHPVAVRADLSQATGRADTLAAGHDHACVLMDTGRIWCWGRRASGALGDGQTQPPGGISEAQPGHSFVATSIRAGQQTTLVQTASGEIWGWGSNASYALGDGLSHQEQDCVSCSFDPVQVAVAPPLTVSSFSFRKTHGCLVTDQQGVMCWGSNRYGQIGNGTTETASVPTDVSGLPQVVDVFSGDFVSCSLDVAGALWCWGKNDAYGSLGDGSSHHSSCDGVDCSLLPLRVSSPY